MRQLRSLSSLLSCRLRNGFTVNEVKLEEENQLQVKLTLPWKINTFIHYVIKSAMSVDSENINGATTSSTQASSPQDPNCHVEVFLDGMCLYVQCPLGFATLDKAAALGLATATPLTDLRQYINSDLGFSDLKCAFLFSK